MSLGHMLRNLKEEIFSKFFCIQFIKKLKIKYNAHILIKYFYIWFINLCLKGTSYHFPLLKRGMNFEKKKKTWWEFCFWVHVWNFCPVLKIQFIPSDQSIQNEHHLYFLKIFDPLFYFQCPIQQCYLLLFQIHLWNLAATRANKQQLLS